MTTLRFPAGGPASRPAAAGRPPGDDFARAHLAQLRELEAAAPVLIRAFGDDVPDVVVCDPMSWAGRVLAARWRVPAVTAVTSMITNTRWSLGPAAASFSPAHPDLPRLFAAATAALARYDTGLTADQLLATEDGIPVIAYYPRAFQVDGGQFGSRVCFAGPCLATRPGAPDPPGGTGRQSWRRPGEGPLVLFSLGTVVNRQPALFRRCLEALAGTDCQVVAALGGLDAATLGPLPASARAYTYLPLMEVMPAADVFLGHGGMGSSMEALSCGVPVAALPQTAEQQLTADRLAGLGLGCCLEPARQTQEAVRTAVRTLLREESFRSRAAWMRAEIERTPGPPAAVRVIEDALRASRVSATSGTGANE